MPEALGALTVALADSPTTQARRARPESSTESTFAEVLADSPAFAPQVAKVMQPLPFLRVSDVVAALPPGASATPRLTSP